MEAQREPSIGEGRRHGAWVLYLALALGIWGAFELARAGAMFVMRQDGANGSLVYSTRFVSFEAAMTMVAIIGVAAFVSFRLYHWLRKVKSPSIRWAPVLVSVAVFTVVSLLGGLAVGVGMDQRGEVRFSDGMQQMTVVRSNFLRPATRAAFARSDVEGIAYAGDLVGGSGKVGLFLRGQRDPVLIGSSWNADGLAEVLAEQMDVPLVCFKGSPPREVRCGG